MLCNVPRRISVPAAGAAVALMAETGIDIMITGEGHADYCYLMIAGVKYFTTASVTVDAGTEISVFLSGESAYPAGHKVYVNGAEVMAGAGTYSCRVTTACTISLTAQAYGSTAQAYYHVTITTG